MPALETVAAVSAVISAIIDVSNSDAWNNFSEVLRRKRKDTQPTQAEIDFFSTYRDEEMKELEKRLINCSKRFVAEGNGNARRACLCSVLTDIYDGNNGFPKEEWSKLAKQLCGTIKRGRTHASR